MTICGGRGRFPLDFERRRLKEPGKKKREVIDRAKDSQGQKDYVKNESLVWEEEGREGVLGKQEREKD